MCGRFSLYFFPQAEAEFEQRFGIPFPTHEYPPAYNIPPNTDIPVVVQNLETGENEVRFMHWGLIPGFAKEFKPDPRYKMSNTRAESFDKSNDFRKKLLAQTRGIVPANNYFEWLRQSRRKIPFKIERPDNPLLSLAAIYSTWRNAEGEKFYSCSIITVPANNALKRLHGRMPFVVRPDDEAPWLDRGRVGFEEALKLVTPFPDDGLRAVPVSPRVNSPANNDPDVVQPLEQPPGSDQFDLFDEGSV